MGAVNSPFVVPLGAFLVAIVAIVAGVVNQVHGQRLKAEQRLAMLARGMSADEVVRLLGEAEEPQDGKAPRDPRRSIGFARRTALVLISSGLGLILFFAALTVILHTREVLAGAAVGLVPLAIGVGFWVDYRLQVREAARLGLGLPDWAK